MPFKSKRSIANQNSNVTTGFFVKKSMSEQKENEPKLQMYSKAYKQIDRQRNKAGYSATPVACGWAGAIFEVTGAFGQER